MASCVPSWTRGGCVPVITVEDQGNCAGPTGGTKTVGAPQFDLVVTNPPNRIWTDEDLVVIQAEEDGSPMELDNI